MGIICGNPSTQMDGLVSSFQSKESNSMLAEEMDQFALTSTEAAYEDPGEQAPMVFMVSGWGFHDGNASQWWDNKNPSFTRQTCLENTNWETVAVHMSVAKYAIRKTGGRFNALLECWGFTNYPRYHS